MQFDLPVNSKMEYKYVIMEEQVRARSRPQAVRRTWLSRLTLLLCQT